MPDAKVASDRRDILVIDDDPDVCRVLSENLSGQGFRVATAMSGSEGVEKARQGRYGLIILDLKLPDVSGMEVLRRIRNFDKDVVIIILTGYPTVETAVETLKNTAADYILKPFDVNHLKDVILRELEGRHSRMDMDLTEVANVGERIRRMRKAKGMSLALLAGKADLSKSYLSELERKKKSPGVDTLLSIARGLGVSVYFFFKETR
jgi:DNA-binding response OmpR family regulator